MIKPVLKAMSLLLFALSANSAFAHVPHDIIYSLDASPNYHNDGFMLGSSTQFGEIHMISNNFGETFSETHGGMNRDLVIGHTYSPNFTKDGVVYTLTTKGYYKTTDRAQSWVKQANFQDEAVVALAVAPDYNKSGEIYVLSASGLYSVAKDGKKSTKIKAYSKCSTGTLEFVGNTLYVHTLYHEPIGKKVKGMDMIEYVDSSLETYNISSKKWVELQSNIKSDAVVTAVDVTAIKGGAAMIASAMDGAIYWSNDGGRSWSVSMAPRENDYGVKVAMSPNYTNDGTAVVASRLGFAFMTKDSGKKWEAKVNGLSRWVHHTNILSTTLSFSPNYKEDKTIFFGKTTGFYKTTDDGAYWRHINVWNTKWGYYALPAPVKGNKDVFTATYNSGISRSHDGGDTWHSGNIGITSAFANSMMLSPNYAEDNTIFVMDISTGLYRSIDGGRSWQHEDDFDASKLYGQPSLHRDMGISNNFKDNGLILFFTVPKRTLGDDSKSVWKYNDKTKAIKKVVIESDHNYVKGFAFTKRNAKQEIIFCASAKGLFKSTDLGDTWVNIYKEKPLEKVVLSPNFDEDNTLYIMDATGVILNSFDGGATYNVMRPMLNGHEVRDITNIDFSPLYAKDNTIYLTSYGEGVIKSTDNAKSWTYFALRGKFLYSGVTFSPDYAKDKTMYATAIDGILRSQDNGKSWKNVFDKTQFMPKTPYLFLFDPSGKEINMDMAAPQEMKAYKMYDAEICNDMYKRSGMVKKVSSPKAYLASYYKFMVKKGSALELYFYGNYADVKCVQSKDCGIVEIFVDGESKGTFDMYSPTDKFDVSAYLDEDMEMGFHTIRIETTGTKNPKSEGNAFTYNALTIKN